MASNVTDLSELWDVVAGLKSEAKRAKETVNLLSKRLEEEQDRRRKLEEELREHVRKVEERQLEEMEDDGEEEDVLVVMEDEGEENEVEQNREEGGSDEKIKLVADEKLGVGKEANEEEERRVKQEVEERKVFMAGEDDDVIERVIRQARVVRPLPNQPRVGEVHLLMGDSIARVYPFTVREPDRILNLAEGGMTFRRLADKVEENLTYWHMQLKDWEVKGKVVLWLGGE